MLRLFDFFKSLNIIILFLIGMISYSIGAVLSKIWGDDPSFILGNLIIIAYSIGTFVWLFILIQRNDLALMSLIWQALTMVCAIFIGVFAFKEHLTVSQWFGVSLVFGALYFLTK